MTLDSIPVFPIGDSATMRSTVAGNTQGTTAYFSIQDSTTVQTVRNGADQWRVDRPFLLSAQIAFYLATQPTGAAFILDVCKNGTSIYTTKPRIDANSNSSLSSSVQSVYNPAQTKFVTGDVLRVDVTQIGSTVAGAGLSYSVPMLDVSQVVADTPVSSSLLMHFEGADGSLAFVDSSPLNLTVTKNSGSAYISTATSAMGSSSLALPTGGGGQLNLPYNSALTLDGDFTIEFRALHTEFVGKQHYISNIGVKNIQIARTASGLYFYPPNITRTFPMTANQWTAVAITRSGNTLYWFKDGVLLGSDVDTTNYDLSGGAIGLNFDGGFRGNLDELRIVKGACLYTNSYTLATTPFSS